MTTPNFDLQLACVEVEKNVARYVSNEIEELRKVGGDSLANEMMLTVASLFAARAAAISHTWTGENLDQIKARFGESYNAHVGVMLRNITKLISKDGVTV